MKQTLNTTINRSKNEKDDEHYTQLSDIENEVRHYRAQFAGKTVLCNCDNPRCSNFFKYFTRSFEILGLKRVIATCYKSQDVDLFTVKNCENAVYQIYDGDANGNREVDDAEFGRNGIAAIGDGPYYAMEIVPATLYATGGAEHDINAQAVDWAGRPIPRLYMAGLVGDPYTLHSSALVGAAAWARIAAAQIAGLQPWE